MAEASALISLVATAAHLSRVIIEIGTKYRNAKAQIESFGRELGILSKILDQLRRLLSKDASSLDISFHVLATEIIDECGDMFSQLNQFKEKLYNNPTSQNLSWRGKTKWVFEAAELDYLRERVDSMKVNLLLMMTFQTISGQQGGPQVPNFEEQSKSIQLLTIQSNACVQRLQTLEKDMAIREDVDDDERGSVMSIKTFGTADSVRSFRDSIISLYDGTPYEKDTWSTSQTSFLTAHESQNTHTIVSELVESYLSGAPILRHDMKDAQEESTDSLTAIRKAISQGSLRSVLSLDGGGVRTYSTLLILRDLMAEIALAEFNLADEVSNSAPQPLGVPGDWIPRAYKNETSLNYHPCYYFDYIAGASTGGLAAIMLGRLRMSIKICLGEFLAILGCMFDAPRTTAITINKNPLSWYWPEPKYDHQAFEAKFKKLVQFHDSKFPERFVDGSFGSDPLQVKTIAVACVGPAHNNPYLFRSYDPNDAGVKYDQSHTPTVSIPTWQVARALIAAPKYFPPIEIGDCEFSGGRKELCYASVPVFHEVRRRVEEPSDKNMLFISIGSGNYNGLKFEMQGLSSVTGFMGDTTNVKPRGNFYRFNPPLKRIRYDEWRKIKGVDGNATINQITHETESYLADPRVRESLREIAIGLVQNRRARSEKRNIERYNSLRDV